ncbi:MAG: GDP-L-fucose synthase [Steroidobacteraceae bacterium]
MQLTPDSRIYVAGHRGLVGSAVVRALNRSGHEKVVLRTHGELDLTNQADVNRFFAAERPAVVILAAARVGGIYANNARPALFIRDNLLIQDNVIDAAHRSGVEKFVFLGSSCIYPKLAPQPIKEEYILTGPLEPSNEPYAIAKIAGVKMCQAYRREFGFNAISLMPTNLYGPGDNFDLQNAHVLPSLIRRFHEAAARGEDSVTVWGTGTPRREFLHADDLADAILFLLRSYDAEPPVNIGWGRDVTIRELAELVQSVVGFRGRLVFDEAKPDGTPRKLLDVSRLTHLGWQPKIPLEEGVAQTYAWFKAHSADSRL